MKVIDLLNKIANGEKPTYIKYDGNIYAYNEIDDFYQANDGKFEFPNLYLRELNEEVEIIEEEKGIPEKIRWHEVNGVGDEDDAFYVDVNDKSQYVNSEYDSWEMTTILKINEIIDYLNKENK